MRDPELEKLTLVEFCQIYIGKCLFHDLPRVFGRAPSFFVVGIIVMAVLYAWPLAVVTLIAIMTFWISVTNATWACWLDMSFGSIPDHTGKQFLRLGGCCLVLMFFFNIYTTVLIALYEGATRVVPEVLQIFAYFGAVFALLWFVMKYWYAPYVIMDRDMAVFASIKMSSEEVGGHSIGLTIFLCVTLLIGFAPGIAGMYLLPFVELPDGWKTFIAGLLVAFAHLFLSMAMAILYARIFGLKSKFIETVPQDASKRV